MYERRHVGGSKRPARTPALGMTLAVAAACGAPDAVTVAPPAATLAEDHHASDRVPDAGPVDARDAGALDASDAGAAVTSRPSCPARRGYPPLAVAVDAAVSSDEPKLQPSVKLVQAVVKKWHTDHANRSDCRVLQNDGELLSIHCGSYYVTGNGGVRTGEDTVFNFQRQGDALSELSPDALLPGAVRGARAVIEQLCKWSLEGDVSVDLAPGLDKLHLSLGDGPVWSSKCDLPYQAHAGLIGCGPLARLAGFAASTPGAEAAPLGFALVMHPAEGELSWPHFTGAGGAAAAANQALAAIVAPLKQEAKFHALVNCSVVWSTRELLSVECTGNAGGEVSAGMTFRLAGPPYRVGAGELLAGKRDALALVTRKCTAPYLKQPKTEYDYFLTAAPKWTAADLASFAVNGKSVTYHVQLALQQKGMDRPLKARRTCTLPLSQLGVTAAGLAKPPKP